MLISKFRSSFYLQYVLLIVLTAAMWIRGFITDCPPLSTGDESPLFQLFYTILPTEGFIMPLIGLLLLMLEAFYLNYILIKHEIVPKNSLITAFVYVMIMSQSLPALSLNPVICAAFFVIPALDKILKTYGTADPTRDVFSAALLLALASLFHFPAIFFALILFGSFFVFGTFSIRIFFVGVAGIFTVYLYLFLYYFLNGQLDGLICLYVNWFSSIPHFSDQLPYTQYVLWVFQAIILLEAFFLVLAGMNERNISIRKMILLMIYFLLFSLGSVVYMLDDLRMASLMPALPISIFIATYVANRKKLSWILELFFVIWLIVTIVHNLLIAEC